MCCSVFRHDIFCHISPESFFLSGKVPQALKVKLVNEGPIVVLQKQRIFGNRGKDQKDKNNFALAKIINFFGDFSLTFLSTIFMRKGNMQCFNQNLKEIILSMFFARQK